METRAVLFVDDDQIILKSIQKLTIDESYDNYFARSGEDALEILKQKDVHVIIVDIFMPGINGIELLRIIKKEYPDIVCIAISGYSLPPDDMTVMSELGIYRFITKSWTFDEDVQKVIWQAIDYYNQQNKSENMVVEL